MSGTRAVPRLRVHLATLGCAKNLVDSERLLARLAAAGALVGAPAGDADVIIVNTCGFITPAKEESVEAVLDLARWKRAGRCSKLLVVGCLGQRYGHKLREALPEADGVFGLRAEREIVAACGLSEPGVEEGRLLLTPKHTAYLRIADGCDNRCAYCAIPMIRGGFHSRPFAEIVEEAERLVELGARELNVIGQDTTLYGMDLPGRPGIHDLLERLSRIRKLRWLRLLYTHPAHFTDELVDAFASLEKLCPYVDMPVQHLNDRILKRMGRRTNRARIEELIRRIRQRVPDVAIRTTVIVGFPGESRSDFNELLAGIRALRFEHLGAFGYSREEGTRAARMRGQVSARAIARRLRDVMLAQQQIVFERHRGMKGRRMEVVVESRGAEKDVWIARSQQQAPDVDSVTLVRGRGLRAGRFVKVRVTGARGYDLMAEPVAAGMTCAAES